MPKFLLIFFLFIQFPAVEKAAYDIRILNKTIGDTFTQKNEIEDGSVEYIFKSKAKARVFFKERTSEADVKVIYKNGLMMSATCKYERDGAWEFVKMNRVNGVYEIDNNGEKIVEKNPIKFSVTKLFFEEPLGVQKVWIERLSEYVDLEKIEDHQYRVKVEGKYNFYTYENGKLVEYMNKNIVNVYMNLKQ